MKKLLAICAASVALSSPALAETRFKPYLGLDIQFHSISYQSETLAGVNINYDDVFEDNLGGLNVHGGVRLNEFFGLELGYFRTQEEDSGAYSIAGVPVLNSTQIRLSGFTFDGLGYVPVHERIDLIGTAGISWMQADVEYDATPLGLGTIEEDESEIGFRIGGGVQFDVTDRLNLRTLVRYQTADFEDVVDNAWVYSAGANFSF